MRAALNPELGHNLWVFVDGSRSLTACAGCGRYGSGHRWANLLKPCPTAINGVPRDAWSDTVWRRLGALKHPTEDRLLQKPVALSSLVPTRQSAAPEGPEGNVQEHSAEGIGTGTANTGIVMDEERPSLATAVDEQHPPLANFPSLPRRVRRMAFKY